MINCDFDLCIYNKNRKCLLDRISISSAGCCDTCIVPNFPISMLESYKKDLLDTLDKNESK